MASFRMTALIGALALWLAAPVAHADIYGYIDDQGMGHFSTEKLDERYQLFIQGSKAFDSDKIDAASSLPAGATPTTPLFRTLSQHPNLKKYEAMTEHAAKEFSLEPALLKAVMAVESGFNPQAVSPKGAIGLMQVMPATAARYGLQGDKKKSIEQKLRDPATNIRIGARYLRDLTRLFPAKLDLILASYNAGEGAVQKYRNSVPPYPETRNYVQLVSQFYRVFHPGGGLTTDRLAGNEPANRTPGKRIHMTLPGRSNFPTYPLASNR